jgi:hypothetical protein
VRGQAFGFVMVIVIVLLPGNVIDPCVVPHEGTLVGVSVGVRLGVRVLVTVGDKVAVGVREGDGVILGVLETTGVGEAVLVGVLDGVFVGDAIGDGVNVEVDGVYCGGGAVTWIETLTRTVRALWPLMALPLLAERSRKPTILGTIGR